VTSTLILIHGAWHGAWCWQRLAPLLEAQGRRVVAPDLPSMGEDQTPATDVTLESWARFVANLVEREGDCVLVGHSRGGAVISRAAELAPRAIRHLVYLSAYLLPDGESVAAEARRDVDSLVAPNMIPARRGVTCLMRSEVIREAFYGACDDATAAQAITRLTPEPLKVLAAPVNVSAERFGLVPRSYIETTRDRAVTLPSQRRMQAALPCSPVFTLDTDHSAFLSQPEALARILISI